MQNVASLDLAAGRVLTSDGGGFSNEGYVSLADGVIGGTGPLSNDGTISGYGTVSGGGGFANRGLVSVSGGYLTVTNSGAISNAGNIEIASGRQLRLVGGNMSNTGSIALAAGIVGGTATLTNAPGGTISGRGNILAPLANAGGTLMPAGGNMHVASAFASSGLIRLDDGWSISGGAITNTGRPTLARGRWGMRSRPACSGRAGACSAG